MEEALADAPITHRQPVVVAQADAGDGRVACRVEVLSAASIGGFGVAFAAPHLVCCAPLGGQEPQELLRKSGRQSEAEQLKH